MTEIKTETFSREELTEMKVAIKEFLIAVDRQWPQRRDYEALIGKIDRAIGMTYMGSDRLEDAGKWFRRGNTDIIAEDK
jgi:hypothetical protein